jgi:hypothetical protein
VLFTRPDHRDAPHVFGAGLKEMLADEMTAEWRARSAHTIHQAQQSGQAVTVTLQRKGIAYGHLTVLPDGMAWYAMPTLRGALYHGSSHRRHNRYLDSLNLSEFVDG